MTKTISERWAYCHYHTGFIITASPTGGRGIVIEPEVNQILRIKHLTFRGSGLGADRAFSVGVYNSLANWDNGNYMRYLVWNGDLSNNQKVRLPCWDVLETFKCYHGLEYIVVYPHVLSFRSSNMLEDESVASIDLDLLTNVLSRPNVTLKHSTESTSREFTSVGSWRDV